jgi:hypothetical protein
VTTSAKKEVNIAAIWKQWFHLSFLCWPTTILYQKSIATINSAATGVTTANATSSLTYC